MPVLCRSTLPNAITVARILMAPAIFFLVFVPGFTARLIAFFLFVVAAVSDLWDGYLARKYGWITDFGKLVDPIADKLLLAATFVPFYMLSHRATPVGPLPHWGELPLWVLLVVFGRELLITAIRAVAAGRGVVIPAGKAGKYKAVTQNIFVGSVLLWYALQTLARSEAWAGQLWHLWQEFHGAVLALALALAVLLTVYSMAVYLWNWRMPRRSAA
ncbi:MAG: CDP-diacylglycerol--glycerol-3-phosphate 3-phosphatidyltransferase [Gemmatimonadetes bacterium]|nr:CDP-diacylglycerol--glycerol-3-phosphate 3-phosphatidyltransferase [Gemmatimonadota bacterium]